jgi:hypothetical protein
MPKQKTALPTAPKCPLDKLKIITIKRNGGVKSLADSVEQVSRQYCTFHEPDNCLNFVHPPHQPNFSVSSNSLSEARLFHRAIQSPVMDRRLSAAFDS